MNWWDWLILVVYAIGWLMCGRAWARNEYSPSIDRSTTDIAMLACIAMFVGLLWPIGSPFLLARWFVRLRGKDASSAAVARALFGEERDKKNRRLERERREREAYVARLERELGINS